MLDSRPPLDCCLLGGRVQTHTCEDFSPLEFSSLNHHDVGGTWGRLRIFVWGLSAQRLTLGRAAAPGAHPSIPCAPVSSSGYCLTFLFPRFFSHLDAALASVMNSGCSAEFLPLLFHDLHRIREAPGHPHPPPWSSQLSSLVHPEPFLAAAGTLGTPLGASCPAPCPQVRVVPPTPPPPLPLKTSPCGVLAFVEPCCHPPVRNTDCGDQGAGRGRRLVTLVRETGTGGRDSKAEGWVCLPHGRLLAPQ